MSGAAPAWEAILPARLAFRPRDHRGFPVPAFVTRKDDQGRWDFVCLDAGTPVKMIREKRCWVCGQPLGRFMAFVSGPMCVVSRTSAEPPSHRECAEFSAQVCPFLTKPRMRRNEAAVPADVVVPGIMLARNPGVTAVYVTRSYATFRPPGGGTLIEMGPPAEVGWWAEGRAATRAEVNASIQGGMPSLVEAAQQDGPRGLAALEARFRAVLSLLPPVVPPDAG